MNAKLKKTIRYAKVLFASYAASIAVSILGIIFGTIFFGFEGVDSVIEKYSLYVVGVATILFFPFLNKKMK